MLLLGESNVDTSMILVAQTEEHLAGTCECGKEPSGSIKFREFLD
jgi:hypothetical protein